MLLVCLAPLLLLVAGIWNRQAGLREDLELTVDRFLPAAVELDQLPALPTEAKDPDVLMVMLGVGAPKPLIGFLHANGPTGFRREEPQGRFAVLFREALDLPLLEELKPRLPKNQRLMAKWGKEALEIPAEPGMALEVGGGTLRVVALYPDFEVRPDAEGRPFPGTRSNEPKDPWLEAAFLRPGQPPRRVLLSARQPDLTRRLNAPNLPEGLSLEYLREGEELQTRFVVFSRQDHRVSLVEQGAVTRSEVAAANRPFIVAPGLSVTALGYFDRFYPADAELNAAPALRLKVKDARRGQVESIWLRPNEPALHPLLSGRVSVGMVSQKWDPKDLHLKVRMQDSRGKEWPPQIVRLADGGRSAYLHLSRRPAAWLTWVSFALALVGSGIWLVFLWRQLCKTSLETS